ncbi:MAG: CBS domain-containing protein [Haloarculaceae archaeon]
MDIKDIVSPDYESLAADATVSELVGRFEDPAVRGVVVTDADGAYRGVVTRRQLTASHHPPDEKVGSLVWHVPRVSPTEDVRAAARLMLDGDTRLLPVFEGEHLRGVVTVDDLLAAVEPFLDAATVADVASTDLVTVTPEATFGEALHRLREERIAHLPVVEDDTAVGILSLYDVVPLAARAIEQSQGGNAAGFDERAGGARSHGGFGAREGELARMLDLPVRDVMVSPVRTIGPAATLEDAVARMFDAECSSLIVTTDGSPFGIVTKSDVLAALTWEAEGNRAVQVTGTDYLDDVSYDDVVATIEKLDGLDEGTAVLDAKLHLHEHDERLRGTPLLLARLRLYTDDGLFVATGEGYGASAAINEARDVMERRLRERKTYDRSKKHPGADFWEKRFGWMLEEA